MITISERKTDKVVGYTSLFVSFEYRKEHVDFIHTLDGCNWSQGKKLWEIPIIYLSEVLDYFCQVDDIDLTLLEDEPEVIVPEVHLDTTSYKIQPFNFQLDAIKYGLQHNKWLLLDPPGLGKTAVIIHIIEELIARGELEHCLVICGLNALKDNWRKEIEKHSRTLTSTILGQRQKRDGSYIVEGVAKRIEHLSRPIPETVVITNIETIRNKDIVELIENGPNKFDLIVCDEIHKVKNKSSQQGDNFLQLKKHKYKIGATGTLLMNSPLDAYVPLSWIGVERSTVTNFKNFYCRTNGNILLGYQHTDILKEMISSNSLRRPKSLLQLPPLRIINEYVQMDEKQQKFYNEIKAGIRDQVDKVVLRRSNILSIIGRLRQATACPSVLTTHNIPSAKVERCCDLVDQIVSGGEKVLIFSTFKETTAILKERLKDYKPLVVTGDVDESTASSYVDKFQQDPEHKCFIGTWQKCGTGLTLTAATYVIFLDTAWTWAETEQSFSRAYRAGTKLSVTVYFLITTNTIDEVVQDANERKEVISDYMIGELSENQMSDNTYEILKKYIYTM